MWHRLLDTTAVQYKTIEIMITGSQVSKLETNAERRRRGMYVEACLVQPPVSVCSVMNAEHISAAGELSH